MKLKEVISSSIYAAGYSKKKQELVIEFISGGTYKYTGVQPDIYDAFLKADSQGIFFSSTIKGCYDFEKIN